MKFYKESIWRQNKYHLWKRNLFSLSVWVCNADEFQCKNSGKCLPKALQCNGALDCGEFDESDEVNCSGLFRKHNSWGEREGETKRGTEREGEKESKTDLEKPHGIRYKYSGVFYNLIIRTLHRMQ